MHNPQPNIRPGQIGLQRQITGPSTSVTARGVQERKDDSDGVEPRRSFMKMIVIIRCRNAISNKST